MPSAREAGLKHAKYYEGLLREAEKRYLLGGDSVAIALALVENEWANVVAGHKWVSAFVYPGDSMDELRVGYAIGAPYCLDFRLTGRERQQWLELALNSARNLKNRVSESAILNDLGIVFSDQEMYEQAINIYHQALQLARATSDRRREGVVLDNLGHVYRALGSLGSGKKSKHQWLRAIQCHQRAISIDRSLAYPRDESRSLANLADTFASQKLYHRAIRTLERSLAIAEECGDKVIQIDCLNSLASTHGALQDLHRSGQYWERVRVLQHEINDSDAELRSLSRVAGISFLLGDTHKGIETAEKAVSISRQRQDKYFESDSLLKLGAFYQVLGKSDEALEYYASALFIYQQAENHRSESEVLKMIALMYLQIGVKKESLNHLNMAVSALKENNLLPDPELMLYQRWATASFFLFHIYFSFMIRFMRVFPKVALRIRRIAMLFVERLNEFSYSRYDHEGKVFAKTQVIKKHPKNPKAYLDRGMAYYDMHDDQAALEDFLKGIELAPSNPQFHFGVARIYDDRHEYQNAITFYTNAIAAKPNEAYLWSRRGFAHFHKGNYLLAHDDFSQAIRLKPKRACYYSHRGLALYRLGRTKESQDDFAHAQSLKIDDGIFMDLAASASLQNDLSEVVNNLRKAHELYPFDTVDTLREDPCFDVIRDTPEIQALLLELGD